MAKGLEVGILTSQAAILRIELDRSQQARHRVGELTAQGEDDGAHVVSVVVEGLVSDNVTNVSKRLSVFAGIESKRSSVKLFLNATWHSLLLPSVLAVADVEIELHAFVQLFLLGIVCKDRTKNLGRLAKLVSLKCLKPLLVQGNCLNVGSSNDGGCGLDGRGTGVSLPVREGP